jgi:hypothetical protein
MAVPEVPEAELEAGGVVMSATPSRPPVEPPSDSGDRVMLWIVGGVVLLLAIVGIFTYDTNRDNEQAQQLAAELTQKLEAAGLNAPEDPDILVRSLGDDGGAVCDNPANALGRALLFDNLTNGASFVGRRPVIADSNVVRGELLILDTYCPDAVEEFNDKFDDLKFDDTVKD